MIQKPFAAPNPIPLGEGHSSPLLLPGHAQLPALRSVNEVRSGFATLLRRHRRAIILFLTLSSIASLLYLQFAPKTYKVQAVLEIRGLNQDFMNLRDVNPTGTGMVDQVYIETQMRLLQNDAITSRVVRQMAGAVPANLGSSADARDTVIRRMLETVKVKEEGASNLVRISLQGPDPRLAAETANQLAGQYIEEEQNARTTEAAQTDIFLRQQLNQVKTKLQSSEDALQAYAHNSGIVLTNGSQESVASEHLRQVQQGLAQAEVDLAARQAQLDMARHTSGESLPEVVNNPVIREDQSKLRDLRVQLADLSTTMTPANYKVQKLQAQIQDLEQEMARYRSILVERLTIEQREASRRTALLEDQYRRQLLNVMDQGSKQVRYNMLRNDVDVNRQIYQSMVQKAKEAGVMAALRTPNARVVSEAQPPERPSSPRLAPSLGLGLLLGVVGLGLYVLLVERHDRSLRIPGQSEEFLPNAELAAIPRVHLPSRTLRAHSLRLAQGGDRRDHPMLEHWMKNDGTVLSEAFRMAATSILLRTAGGTQSRVLLITSPHPQCGKTMSTANLAVSLAEGSRKVLVVDADLRKSGLSHLFGVETASGFSDVLSNHTGHNALDFVRPTDFPGIWILPSGMAEENAAKLLQSDRLRSVLDLLRSEFDFVLLDGPPLLGLADARLLGRRAEAIILICRAGYTEGDELNEAWSILREDGAHVLGTILNGYDLRTERPSRYRSYIGYTGTIS